MLVYRLWYRRELPFTIHDAVAATIPIHAPFIPFNIERRHGELRRNYRGKKNNKDKEVLGMDFATVWFRGSEPVVRAFLGSGLLCRNGAKRLSVRACESAEPIVV